MSLINKPVFTVIDSPVTFGLSKVVNQEKFEGTLADNCAFTELPLQISIAVGIERITSGITVTVKFELAPKHPCGTEVGVTVYCTFCGLVVVFVKVLLIIDDVCAKLTSPLTVLVAIACHTNDDGISLARFTMKAVLLQIVNGLIGVRFGEGFTVISDMADAKHVPVPIV